MKRLNIQFDNVVISFVNESKKKNEKLNFENNNVIEFISESIDSIEKKLMIKNIFSINELKIVKVKKKSHDVKSKQSSMTRTKKKTTRFTKRDLFKFEHVDRVIKFNQINQSKKNLRDRNTRKNKIKNENRNEKNQRVNVRSASSTFQLIENDEHSFERITRKKQNTKMIHEIFNDMNDSE